VRKKHTQAQKLVHGGRTRLRLVTGEIKVIAAKATDAITDNVTHSSTAAPPTSPSQRYTVQYIM
jgi:hypothetical protein